MRGSSSDTERVWTRRAVFLLLGLGLLRLLALRFSPLGLHGDEAQYWSWSRHLDFGYFSKPPMIAWLIAVTTSLFGHSEWAVRLSSPVLHPLIGGMIFLITKRVYAARTGFWAAGIYFLMPAVWLSSGIVSTDVPLLLCWSVALYAFFSWRAHPSVKAALLLGLAFGLGMLSKYAMLFFLPALAGAALVDTASRRVVFSTKALLAAGVALAVMAPNIWWNAHHGFATLAHTAANANLQDIPFHPVALLEFLISQLGVFGPVLFPLMMGAGFLALRGRLDESAQILALFTLAPLLVISLEAFMSRANANWAVTSYISGAILLARFACQSWPRLLKFGVGVNVVIGLVFVAGGLAPAFADAIGQANALKRLRAWPATTSLLAGIINAGHKGQAFQAVATDNRLVFYDLKYYGLDTMTGVPLKMWRLNKTPHNHAEATEPLVATNPEGRPVLILSYYSDYEDKFRADFSRLDPIGQVEIPLGGGKVRRYSLYAGYGYTPTEAENR